MFRSIDDFVAAWTDENEKTRKVLAALTDASLAQKVTPKGRSLGFLAWHVVTTITEMLPLAESPRRARAPIRPCRSRRARSRRPTTRPQRRSDRP